MSKYRTPRYKTQITSSKCMHPLRQHPSRKAVEHVAEVTGQPISLSLFSNHFTEIANATGTHSSRQPGRTCFTFLSLKEKNNFTRIFFLIIMVAWKFSLTHWTTREVLHSSFLKNKK